MCVLSTENKVVHKREKCCLNTENVNSSFCWLIPAWAWLYFLFDALLQLWVWGGSLCERRRWEIFDVLHRYTAAVLSRVWVYQSMLPSQSHTNAQCWNVLCWLRLCSSCSFNFCVTVFKTQSSRCEQRKWQRWVECWSHLWIEPKCTHTKPSDSSVSSCCLSLSLSPPCHKPPDLMEALLRETNASFAPLCVAQSIVPFSLCSSHMFIEPLSKSQQAIVPAGLILNPLAQYEEKETFCSGHKLHIQLCVVPCFSLPCYAFLFSFFF